MDFLPQMRHGRKPLLALVGLGIAISLLFLMGLGNHSLWETHEPYVGGIIRDMAASRDLVVPTLNGHPYLEKPPLFYALAAWVCRLFGTTAPWALRLPSALLGIVTAFWCGFLGWRLRSARAGGWAALLVATSYLFFKAGHMAVVDMTLTAMVSLSLGLALLASLEPRLARRWSFWFWASLGLVFLAKGGFGLVLVLVLVPVAAVVVLDRDPKSARPFLAFSWGMVVAAGLITAWVIPLAMRGGPAFLGEVFVRNTWGRFAADPSLVPHTGRVREHANPFYFYILNTPGSVLPWSIPWAVALWTCFPRRPGLLDLRKQFIPLVFVIGAVILSCSTAKRNIYLLPMLPLTLVHTAAWLDGQMQDRARGRMPGTGKLLVATLAVVGLLGIIAPVTIARKHESSWTFALGWAAFSIGLSILCGLVCMRRSALAFDAILLHWFAILFVFTVFAVPHLDQPWLPVRRPYQVAQRLETRGVRVLAGNLNESRLGYAGLELHHAVPEANSLEAIEQALASPGPVAVLADGAFWTHGIQGQVPLSEFPVFDASLESRRNPRLAGRTPRLLLNQAAKAFVSGPSGAEILGRA
jgi:4-amino-4-deoxy-L-arabinose transferase-like glycosyltransferase